MQIAFYYTTRLYHSILKPHGWEGIGETIAAAFRKGDFAAMAAAVPDEMVDAIAIAGRPEEVRDQLKQWEPLADHVLLYSPSVGMKAGARRRKRRRDHRYVSNLSRIENSTSRTP